MHGTLYRYGINLRLDYAGLSQNGVWLFLVHIHALFCQSCYWKITVIMKSFLVDMCRGCLKENGELAVRTRDPDLEDTNNSKYIDILRECFPDLTFDEHFGYKLCDICSLLLHGTHLLRGRLVHSQQVYQQYVRALALKSKRVRNPNKYSKLSLQLERIAEETLKELAKETQENYSEEEDFCGFTTIEFKREQTEPVDDEPEEEVLFNYNNLYPEVKLETSDTMKMDFEYNFPSIQNPPVLANEVREEQSTVPSVSTHVDNADVEPPYSNSIYNEEYMLYSNTVGDHTYFRAKAFVCKKCEEEFDSVNGFFYHVRLHNGKEFFKCDRCNLSFISFESFQKHHAKHGHKVPGSDAKSQGSGKKGLKCTSCNKAFPTIRKLKQHTLTHVEDKQLDRKSRSGKNIVKYTQGVVKTKSFKCPHCDKAFAAYGNLVRHARIHTGVKTFLCEYCGKVFLTCGYLIHHKRVHKRKTKNRFKCNFCNNAFPCPEHNNGHQGEKRFGCEYCGKVFKSSEDLVQHNVIHSGKKPFKCNHCNKAFMACTTLMAHRRIHYKENQFKCHHCPKIFSRRGNLKEHEHLHTGEYPFRCQYCGKPFISYMGFHQHVCVQSQKKTIQSTRKRQLNRKRQKRPSTESVFSNMNCQELNGRAQDN